MNFISYDSFRKHIESNLTFHSFNTSEPWVIMNEIESQIKEKIETVGTPLKDWAIKISNGIKTGFNKAFIIDEYTRSVLLAKDPKCEEIIKPILRGRDIKRHSYKWEKLFLINTHNGIKSKNIPPVEINDYLTVKRYLNQYYDNLEKRQDQGVTPYNLRDCAYLDSFEKEKLIFSNMTTVPSFAYDDSGFLANQKCYIITGVHLKYLFAIFNSKFFHSCFWNYFPSLGKDGRELGKVFFVELKIPIPNKRLENKFEKKVDEILQRKKDNKSTEILELEIDEMVYELYGLTVEEIEYIKKNRRI